MHDAFKYSTTHGTSSLLGTTRIIPNSTLVVVAIAKARMQHNNCVRTRTVSFTTVRHGVHNDVLCYNVFNSIQSFFRWHSSISVVPVP